MATALGILNLDHGWRCEVMLRSGRLSLPLIAETRIRFRARLLGFVADTVARVRVIFRLRRISGVPRNFVQGGVQQIQLRTEDRENEDLGAVSPRQGSGGSCNLVQEISFHIVTFS